MKKGTGEETEIELRRKGAIIKKLNNLKYVMMVSVDYDDDIVSAIVKVVNDLREDYFFQASEYFMGIETDNPILKSLEKI